MFGNQLELLYLIVWSGLSYGTTNLFKCNTLNESHRNERDPEVVQVWDCTVKNILKKLIGTTYINKMHLFFGSLSLKNSIIKRAWLRVIIRWVTFWKVSRKTSEWGQNTLKSPVLVCGDNHWSWEQSSGVKVGCWCLEKDYLRKVLTNKDIEWSVNV